MSYSLDRLVSDLAAAFLAIDQSKPIGKSQTREYRAGIGPLREAEAVRHAIKYLKNQNNSVYQNASPCRYPNSKASCDLLIPGEWALEFKLVRPFGDNGKEAEHWSENILHPYPGNVSSIGDCLKLAQCGFGERKAVIVFGYEHIPPQITIESAVRAFELLAKELHGLKLTQRAFSSFGPLVHPIHQQGQVFGWEVLPA